MTNLETWTNNASSLLASGINAAATSVTVTATQGALFPAISAGQIAVATLEDTSGNIEIVQVTGRTGDTMTIVRAQEGTTALSFASGSRFELRVTAAVLASFLQKNGGDTLTGTTTNNGVLQQNTSGSVQGGEFTGFVRGAPGQTANQFAVPVGSGPATVGGSAVLTTANLLNNLPSGAGLNLTGMIMLWSGTSGTVPSGYHVCDGTNGTPNLQDKFVLGAGGALPTSGGSVSSSTDSAGSVSITGTALTLDQIPGHTHTFWNGGYGFYNGSSGGYGILLTGGSQQQNFPTGESISGQTMVGYSGGSSQGTQSAANTHTHTVSATLNHSHASVLPPYVALFYIMKL